MSLRKYSNHKNTMCHNIYMNTARVSNESDRDNFLAVFLEVQMVFVIL